MVSKIRKPCIFDFCVFFHFFMNIARYRATDAILILFNSVIMIFSNDNLSTNLYFIPIHIIRWLASAVYWCALVFNKL